MEKLKVIKVVINNPLSVIGICSQFGDCSIIKNSIYIVTKLSASQVKQKIKGITNIGFDAYVLKDFIPEVLLWLEHLQVDDIQKQMLKNLLETVKK